MHFTQGRRDLIDTEKFSLFKHEIKAVVFDIDGTLIDTIGQIIECTRLTFSHHSLPIPPQADIQSIIGKKLLEGLTSLLPQDKKSLGEAVTATYRSFYAADEKLRQNILFNGVNELFTLLKNKNYKIGIASGKSTAGINRTLEETGLDVFVDAVCSGDEVPSKPDKAMMLTVAERLFLEPHELLGVGDAGMDIEMYHNAGSHSCAVESGVWSGDGFKVLKPEITVPDVSHLIKLFS